MSEVEYWQTSIRPRSDPQAFDAEVNAHFAEMAAAGWELVTVFSTILPSILSYPDNYTDYQSFVWKRQ